MRRSTMVYALAFGLTTLVGCSDASEPAAKCDDGAPTVEDEDALADAWLSSTAHADDAQRQCAVRAVIAEHATLVLPEGRLDAPTASPSARRLTRTSVVDAHHEWVRFTWHDEESGLDGMDFLSVGRDDMRIALAIRFEGAQPAGAPPSAPQQAYFDAWNEADDAARATLLTEAWSEAGRYVDPTVDAIGREALVEHIAGYREQFEGTEIVLTSDVQANAEWFWVTWQIRDAEGASVLDGMDVGRLGDDRVDLIVGFFGTLGPK